MNKFNEKIFEHRKENNFTQEDIAKKLNVSRQTISNWETGAAQPTIDKVIELANLYNVTIDELVENSQSQQPSDLLYGLLNNTVTLYLNPTVNFDTFISFEKTTLSQCKIIEVTSNSIYILLEEKKKKIEKMIFIKDILGFELEGD